MKGTPSLAQMQAADPDWRKNFRKRFHDFSGRCKKSACVLHKATYLLLEWQKQKGAAGGTIRQGDRQVESQ